MLGKNFTLQGVVDCYEVAAKNFAEAVSKDLKSTDFTAFLGLFDQWLNWEEVYVARGFRALPLYIFLDYWNDSMEPVPGLGERLKDGEASELYAPKYAIDNNLVSVFEVALGDF